MGIKQCEIAKRIWKQVFFRHASIFVVDYLNKNKFLMPYLHSVKFLYLTK